MTAKPLRVDICVGSQNKIYMIAWLTESKSGVYIGFPGIDKDFHASYHQDGTRHTKTQFGYFDRYRDLPVNSIRGVRKLEHISLSLSKEWCPLNVEYTGDPKSKSVILVSENKLQCANTLTLDLWLSDLSSDEELREEIDMETGSNFPEVAKYTGTLKCYPQHQVTLIVGALSCMP